MGKKLIKVTIFFFLVLLVCTYLSRSMYIWKLPHVTLDFSQKRTFDYEISVRGKLELAPEGSKYPYQTVVFIPYEELGGYYMGEKYASQKITVIVGSLAGDFEGEILSYEGSSTGVAAVVGFDAYSVIPADKGVILVGGENTHTTFKLTTYSLPNTVPIDAVRFDGEDNYILTVKEQAGPLGREFRTEKLLVYQELTFGRYASIVPYAVDSQKNIEPPIVVNSDRLLIPGGEVRFYP